MQYFLLRTLSKVFSSFRTKLSFGEATLEEGNSIESLKTNLNFVTRREDKIGKVEKKRARTYPQGLISVLVRNNHNNHSKHCLGLLHKLSIYSILVDLLTIAYFQKELSLAIIHLLR